MNTSISPDSVRWPCVLSDELKQRLLGLSRLGRGLKGLGLENGGRRFPGVIYFLKGSIHLYITSAQERGFVGAVLGAGDWLGAMVVAGQNQTDFIVADEVDSIEYRLFPTEALLVLAQEHPELYQWLYFLAAEIQPKWLQASITSLQDKQTRLIYSLLQLLAKNPPPQGVLPQVRIAQEPLSHLAGISRPRLNEVLKQLEAAGELEILRGCIRVLDLPALCRRLRYPVLRICDPRQQEPLKSLLQRSS